MGGSKKNVLIIGAGQLGSRHLQALKNVDQELSISVVDPSPESLKIAKERFESFEGCRTDQEIDYLTEIPSIDSEISVAIIPSTSNVRGAIIRSILEKNEVQTMILEKILFSQKDEYKSIPSLLSDKGVRSWVNCSMRIMPFYKRIRSWFEGSRIEYNVTGSQYGLVTNLIHYVDHMCSLIGSTDFEVITDFLDRDVISSKRKGFVELTGTCMIRFSNGSVGVISCEKDGDLPVQIAITSKSQRVISRESEGKAWSCSTPEWTWIEEDARVPYQSEMTSELVTNIFETGDCGLVSVEESSEIHMNLLEPLCAFIEKVDGKPLNNIPFT